MNLARETDPAKIANTITGDDRLSNAGIILFQEVPNRSGVDVARVVAERLGLNVVAVPSAAESPNQGLAVLSRFPLNEKKVIPLRRHNLWFHSRVRFALAVTAHTPGGPLRIWNVHLDSRINPRQRAEQLEPVLQDAAQWPGRKLIGGDLNTTNFEWFENLIPVRMGSSQTHQVEAAFQAAGFAAATDTDEVTYPFLRQHLDWLFAHGLTAQDSGTAPAPFSDHLAIWATLAAE